MGWADLYVVEEVEVHPLQDVGLPRRRDADTELEHQAGELSPVDEDDPLLDPLDVPAGLGREVRCGDQNPAPGMLALETADERLDDRPTHRPLHRFAWR